MNIDYGKEIRDIRNFYDLSAVEVSRKAGLCKEYVTNVESLKVNTPRLDNLLELVGVLNRHRVAQGHSIAYLKSELPRNIIVDLMSVIERRYHNR